MFTVEKNALTNVEAFPHKGPWEAMNARWRRPAWKRRQLVPDPSFCMFFLGGIGEVPLDFHTDIPTWRKCTKENVDNMQVQDNKYPYEKI